MRGTIANALAIIQAKPFPTVVEPRVTRTSINVQIEEAVVRFAGDTILNRLFVTIDDSTAQSGKMAGDMWLAASRLKELAKEATPAFPLLEVTNEHRIRQGLYRAVLYRLKLHRVQRIAAFRADQAIAAREAAKEEIDHSGE